MSNIKWNKNQQMILDFRGGNMVVAASAGSGKTTVMLERIMRLIDEGVPIDRIVILAFNRSIASEIKGKLYKSILAKIESGDNTNQDFLCEQLDNISYANIVTNDAYCGRTVREFFHILGIDPDIDIIGDKEGKVLFRKSFDMAVDTVIDKEEEWIYDLLSKLGGQRGLYNEICRIDSFATTSPNTDEWISMANGAGQEKGIDNCIAMMYFLDMLKDRAEFAIMRLDIAIQGVIAQIPEYAERYKSIQDFFHAISKLSKYKDIYTIVNSYEFEKKPVKKGKIAIDWDEQERCFKDAKDIYLWICDMVKNSFERAQEVQSSTTSDIEKLLNVYTDTIKIFNDDKTRANRFTFSDFTQKTLQLLSREDIRAEISARYDYISIDEFQDTNYAQESMFQGISNGNNLFMVGDSKQSIYGFRCSEPEIMLGKYRDYESGKVAGHTVHLDNNYRSDAKVLDFVNKIFNNVMHKRFGGVDYAVTDKLIAGADYKPSGLLKAYNIDIFIDQQASKNNFSIKDDIYSVKNDIVGNISSAKGAQEGKFIADKIHELVTTGWIYDTALGCDRHVDYRDIVILSRKKSGSVREILRVIQEEGIPIDISALVKSADIYEVEIIKEIFKIIANDMLDHPLSAVLNSYWIGMKMDEQFELRTKHSTDKYFYKACLLERGGNSKIDKLYKMIEEYRLMSSYMNLQELASVIVYGSGYDKYLLASKGGGYKLAAVKTFINALASIGSSVSVSEYVESIQSEEYELDGLGKGNMVTAMTIHKSKGLEFPIVFLCNIDSSKGGGGLDMPKVQLDKDIGIAINYFDEVNRYASENFVFKVLQEKKKFDDMNEAMRLLYVGLTRAKNSIFLTGGAKTEGIKYKSPYKANALKDWIFNTAIADGTIEGHVRFHDAEQVAPAIMQRYTFKKVEGKSIPEIDKYLDFEYLYKKNTNTSIKYTVTEINSIDSYEDGMEVDSAMFEEYEPKVASKSKRGTNYHAILEHIAYDITTLEQVKAELERMNKEGILTEEELSEINPEEIYRVVTSSLIVYASNNKHYREREFMLCTRASEVMDTTVNDNILVQGAVDLIIDGDELIVVDFKKSNQKATVLKERYKKQLELYSLAVSEALGRKVDKTVIYVIGRDEIIEF